MSSAYASNTVEDATNILIRVAVDATQNCQTQISQDQILNVVAKDGSTINLNDVTVTQIISTDMGCISTTTTQNNISNSLKQAVSQLSKAITQAFAITPSSSIAENVTKLLTNLSTEIQISFNQTCKNVIAQNQIVNIKAINGSKINAYDLNFNQTIDDVIDCVQNNTSVNSVKNQLIQQIEQKAEAIVQSILGPLFAILLIILIVIGFIIFGGVKSITNWKFILTITIIIVVYLGLAFALRWWPF